MKRARLILIVLRWLLLWALCNAVALLVFWLAGLKNWLVAGLLTANLMLLLALPVMLVQLVLRGPQKE